MFSLVFSCIVNHNNLRIIYQVFFFNFFVLKKNSKSNYYFINKNKHINNS